MDIKEEIRKAMKEFQCIPDVAGLNYEDLCIHPDLDLPEGFKVPKFDTFRGVGNPMAHMRAYYDQLIEVGRDEALLMRLFSRSLCGEALQWFTPMKPDNGPVGIPWPRILLIGFLTTWRSFPFDTPWKR